MDTYPQDLVRTHRLFDGRTVTIRPIRPGDDAEEMRFLRTLSDESRYLRFHQWIISPSDSLVHFFTDIDYDRHMAFVCIASGPGGDSLVGEARYVANPDGVSCDFGIVIADKWHKTGIAGLLMTALIEAARSRGYATMEGLVLTRNASMLRFARALGFEVQSAPEDPTTKRIVKRLRDLP